MGRVPYLNSVAVPKLAPIPEPNVKWLRQHIEEWDQKGSANAGLVGIPFDRGVIIPRAGTRLGPKSVREVLLDCTTYSYELDADLSALKIVDCGDVDVDVMSYRETHRRVEHALAGIFGSDMIPLIIGGDHSLTYPCIRGLCRSEGKDIKVGVIDFDAHHDCRTGWEEHHGLWTREIQELEGSPISGRNIVQIGIRGFGYSTFYRDYIKKSGMKVFLAKEIKESGIQRVTEEAIETATDGTDMVYVSVDIDVLDQTSAPGTSAPSPGGLDSWELLSSIFHIGKTCPVRALDLMEVSPPFDVGSMTSRIGAWVILNFLCGLTKRKTKKLE